MKRILWLLFFFPMYVLGQNELPSVGTNICEDLVYKVALSVSDRSVQDSLFSLLQDSIIEKEWNIRLTDNVNDFPDVVVFMEGGSFVQDKMDHTMIQLAFPGQNRQKCDTVFFVSDVQQAADKVVSFLGNTYYEGMRPVYSTVFQKGEGGYVEYRIPSLLTTLSGRILAIAEGRGEGRTDCAENDLVLKYSDDEGKTWSQLVTVAESGEASLNNPTAVYVEEKNRILLLFQEYPPKRSEGQTGIGFAGDNITRFYVVYSDDEGITWSAKKDITKTTKLREATSYACGPGVGLRVVSGHDKGRILIPVNVSGGKRGWFNYLIASDDCGDSWYILNGHSDYGTNESQLVQLTDSTFLINARCHRFKGQEVETPALWNPWRFDKVTRYRGEIKVKIKGNQTEWYPTQIRIDMPDPLCQGSIFRYSGLHTGEISRILFSNPASQISYALLPNYRHVPPARINGTIRLSYDNGNTWKYSKRIYGDRFTEFQYSVITRLKSGRIGCLFETGNRIRFAIFDMEWLSSGTDNGR